TLPERAGRGPPARRRRPAGAVPRRPPRRHDLLRGALPAARPRARRPGRAAARQHLQRRVVGPARRRRGRAALLHGRLPRGRGASLPRARGDDGHLGRHCADGSIRGRRAGRGGGRAADDGSPARRPEPVRALRGRLLLGLRRARGRRARRAPDRGGGGVSAAGGTVRRRAAHSVVAAALALVVLGLAGLGAVEGLEWWGRPFPGFFVLANRLVPVAALPDWSAGVGDVFLAEVTAVAGVRVRDNGDVYRQVALRPPGTPIAYTFRRDGRTWEATFVSRRFG